VKSFAWSDSRKNVPRPDQSDVDLAGTVPQYQYLFCYHHYPVWISGLQWEKVNNLASLTHTLPLLSRNKFCCLDPYISINGRILYTCTMGTTCWFTQSIIMTLFCFLNIFTSIILQVAKHVLLILIWPQPVQIRKSHTSKQQTTPTSCVQCVAVVTTSIQKNDIFY